MCRDIDNVVVHGRRPLTTGVSQLDPRQVLLYNIIAMKLTPGWIGLVRNEVRISDAIIESKYCRTGIEYLSNS